MNSFEEFETADMSEPKVQNPKPEAPQIPNDPNLPAPDLSTPTIEEQENFLNQAHPYMLTALAWIIVLLTFFILGWASWFGYNYLQLEQVSESVVDKPLSVSIPEEKTDKRISKLEGRNRWLRKLLRDEKRKLRVARENLSTKEIRIRNLMQRKTADEQYHEFLRYALHKFHSQPFAEGEGRRSICFTTDVENQKCYQIVRPEGWSIGDPMPRMTRINNL